MRVATGPTPDSWDDLLRVVSSLQGASRAFNSALTYRTGYKQFAKFLSEYNRAVQIPITDDVLAAFVAHCALRGLSVSTIKTYLFAVRAVQLDAGFPFPSWRSRHTVFSTLQGVRRLFGDVHTSKRALTLAHLIKMHGAYRLRRRDPRTRAHALALWACILVGFFGMIRKDNLTKGKRDPFNPLKGLRRGDLSIVPAAGSTPEVAWVRLRYSKTVQFGEAEHLVALQAGSGPLCPVRAIKKHLAETPGCGSSECLFISKPRGPRGGRAVPLSHTMLVSGIKDLLKESGFDPAAFAAHSLRRGGASLAYDLGISEVAIQAHGFWRSDAVRLYREWKLATRLELPAALAGAAARLVGGQADPAI